jgi:hypothetical protein
MLIRILTEQSSILPIQLAVDTDALFRNLLTSHMRYSPIDLFQKTIRYVVYECVFVSYFIAYSCIK